MEKIAKIEKQLQIARKFINKVAYSVIPSGTGQGDTVDECKECRQTSWMSSDIKHKRNCEVGKVIKKAIK